MLKPAIYFGFRWQQISRLKNAACRTRATTTYKQLQQKV